MTTDTQAQDIVYGRVNSIINTDVKPLVANNVDVIWQGTTEAGTFNVSKYRIEIAKQILDQYQACLGTSGQQTNSLRFRTNALLMVNIYSPVSILNSAAKGDSIATLIRNAFRGYASGNLWCSDPRKKEFPPINGFYKVGVYVDFEYDDVG